MTMPSLVLNLIGRTQLIEVALCPDRLVSTASPQQPESDTTPDYRDVHEVVGAAAAGIPDCQRALTN